MILFRGCKYLFIYLLLGLCLFSCANRNSPAPVSSINGSSIIGAHNKGTIKSLYYKVKKGETLYSIAWRANSDVREIANINKIPPPYRIYPGQKLFLVKQNVKKILTKSKGEVSGKMLKIVNENNKKNRLASNKNQAYGKVENGQKASGKGKSFSQKIRQWRWPVTGKIIKHFSSKAQGNKGIDIAGRRGTKIKASANGKVVYAGNALRGYGKLIIIKHNDDYLSAYAHNDRILVKEQQLIKVGEEIAFMGDTDSNQVMLHFEIRFRGKSVNPLNYLPKK